MLFQSHSLPPYEKQKKEHYTVRFCNGNSSLLRASTLPEQNQVITWERQRVRAPLLNDDVTKWHPTWRHEISFVLLFEWLENTLQTFAIIFSVLSYRQLKTWNLELEAKSVHCFYYFRKWHTMTICSMCTCSKFCIVSIWYIVWNLDTYSVIAITFPSKREFDLNPIGIYMFQLFRFQTLNLKKLC